jgi:hypothetical protein
MPILAKRYSASAIQESLTEAEALDYRRRYDTTRAIVALAREKFPRIRELKQTLKERRAARAPVWWFSSLIVAKIATVSTSAALSFSRWSKSGFRSACWSKALMAAESARKPLNMVTSGVGVESGVGIRLLLTSGVFSRTY